MPFLYRAEIWSLRGLRKTKKRVTRLASTLVKRIAGLSRCVGLPGVRPRGRTGLCHILGSRGPRKCKLKLTRPA
ncbi:hypothetical protein HanIR_Chr14g0684861 [Helianthus annuus]|nr:hypothetical protein HanIR_Chr14g0684861 [Helianthus annuus]